MKALLTVVISLFAITLAKPAQASHHRHHHQSHKHYAHRHYRHYARHHRQHNDVVSAHVASNEGRPADCYGIPWCSCWLRHYLHVALGLVDNRAISWLHWGHAVSGPQPGAVGVERHHVFQVVKVTKSGRVLAISGNDSHAVRTRERSTRNVISWRMT